MSVRLRLNLNLKVNPRVTLSNRNHNPTHCPQSLIVSRHVGPIPNSFPINTVTIIFNIFICTSTFPLKIFNIFREVFRDMIGSEGISLGPLSVGYNCSSSVFSSQSCHNYDFLPRVHRFNVLSQQCFCSCRSLFNLTRRINHSKNSKNLYT